MEYFDEPNSLATYDSYEEAVAAVEKGLAAKAGGASKVYRIDVPGKKQTLFGVAMSSETTNNKYMDDTFIMNEIDFKEREQDEAFNGVDCSLTILCCESRR